MEAAFGIQTAAVCEEYVKAANVAVVLATLQHKAAMTETPHPDPFSPPLSATRSHQSVQNLVLCAIEIEEQACDHPMREVPMQVVQVGQRNFF